MDGAYGIGLTDYSECKKEIYQAPQILHRHVLRIQ
jgi:hypothetical protein